MSETPSTTTDSVIQMAHSADHSDRRLRRVLTWVGIVAGAIFIVAVIFFSGLALGRGFGYHGWYRGYQNQMEPGGGMDGGCPMMRNGGGMGPGMMGPGMMDPDDMGPGMMRPGQSPASPGPAPTPR